MLGIEGQAGVGVYDWRRKMRELEDDGMAREGIPEWLTIDLVIIIVSIAIIAVGILIAS